MDVGWLVDRIETIEGDSMDNGAQPHCADEHWKAWWKDRQDHPPLVMVRMKVKCDDGGSAPNP